MKITSVEIHPEGSSDICVLSFRDPRRLNSYNIKGITGLDADEIVPKYYGVSGDSITKYYNFSMEKREIGVLVELNPNFSANESYSDLRDRIYKMIASSRTGVIWINFKNEDESIAAISGFVTKLEASLFTGTPEVQITVTCHDPMLKAVAPTIIDVSELDPALTTIQDDLSTAPHGLTFEMEFTAATASFHIHSVLDEWSFEVTPSGGFLIGDVLHFSSEFKNKYLYIQRGVLTIHLADVIYPGSIWPILFPGENEFVCEDPANMEWVAISHYPTYWGV